MYRMDEPRLAFSQDTGHLRCQVHDMAELFHVHQRIDLHRFWLAHSIDVVPRQIDQHDVFCAVF